MTDINREMIRAYADAEINHQHDCTPEVAAARARSDEAYEEATRLSKLHSAALQSHLDAFDEYRHLWSLAQPLRALLVDALDRIGFQGGPGTAEQIAKYVRRTDLAEVQSCLDTLVADGWIRREPRRRGGYGYAPCWVGVAP